MCDTIKPYIQNHLELVNNIDKLKDFILSQCHCSYCQKIKLQNEALKKIIVFLKKNIAGFKGKLSNRYISHHIDIDDLEYYSRKILFDYYYH